MNVQITRGPTARRTVRFILIDPEAQEVFLAGSFNNWNPTKTPLTDIGHGHWVAEVVLPSGHHEYQFVVDGRWIHDRSASRLVDNPFGGINSVVEIDGSVRNSSSQTNPAPV